MYLHVHVAFVFDAFSHSAGHVLQRWFWCRLHFQLKKDGIQQQLQDWLVATDKHHTKLMKEAEMAINTELERI